MAPSHSLDAASLRLMLWSNVLAILRNVSCFFVRVLLHGWCISVQQSCAPGRAPLGARPIWVERIGLTEIGIFLVTNSLNDALHPPFCNHLLPIWSRSDEIEHPIMFECRV